MSAAPEGVLDTTGMWDVTAAFPEQVEQAAKSSDSLIGLPSHDEIENVVVLGMGGSGIAGDIMTAVAGPFMPVPIVVTKGLGVAASNRSQPACGQLASASQAAGGRAQPVVDGGPYSTIESLTVPALSNWFPRRIAR